MTFRPSLDQPPPPARRATRRWLIVGLAVIVAALAAGAAYGFSYLFLRPAAPAPVGLSSASPSPAGESTAPSASLDGGASASPSGLVAGGTTGGLAGTWTVDTTVGSPADGSGSFVGYRVQEELANVGAATAVGRTGDVTGSLTLEGTTIASVEITADLTTLRSDNNSRDGQLRRQALETGTFPTATFVLTEPIELDGVPAEGAVIEATATGDLTIHGETRSVALALEARLADGVVTVAGSTEIAFADYGIAQPSSFMVLSIDDRGTMEFQLHFRPA